MASKVFITSTDGAVKILALEHSAGNITVYIPVENHSSRHIGHYLTPPAPGEFQFYHTELGTAINKRCVDNSPWLIVTKLPEVRECSSLHKESR